MGRCVSKLCLAELGSSCLTRSPSSFWSGKKICVRLVRWWCPCEQKQKKTLDFDFQSSSFGSHEWTHDGERVRGGI